LTVKLACQPGLFQKAQVLPMKRSRRVVLMLMGTAALSSVSMGFVRRSGSGGDCGPHHTKLKRHGPGAGSSSQCRVTYGGYGTSTHRFHFLGGGG
jgi:hypothetical protein